MNEFLAEMYGTRESIGSPSDDSDVQKLAEAQLLDEALQAEGIDIDKLPGDAILKLAHQILGEDSYLVKAAMEGEEEAEEEEKKKAPEAGEEEPEKDSKCKGASSEESFEEKVAQADFLGRVMAHSYVNEMSDIEKRAGQEKEAGRKLERTLGGSAVGSVKGGLGGALAGGLLGAGVGALKGGRKGALGGLAAGAASGYSAGSPIGSVVGGVKGYRAAKKEEEKYPELKKASSALDMLAEKRAMAWAQENGLLQQQEASDEEKLAAAVDQRAYEMLVAEGIDVDAIEAAKQQ